MSHNLVPLVPMAQSTDRDAEVGQIKRELEILRTRYALYRRMGRILNCFSVGWLNALSQVPTMGSVCCRAPIPLQ